MKRLALTSENLISAAKEAQTTGLTIYIVQSKDGNTIELRDYIPIVDAEKVQTDPDVVTLIPYKSVLEHTRTLVPVYVSEYL
ncbi:hypothetical protein [Paenibacillus polymyxa]|uniref:Uncharacterized protein n=1 Tax=Paenibacillus polymyxa (strain SC2) TaxID=886882 RepID=E3EKX8_PAEPS|nr:hypothetical protein [Paenibacillus polymyxa]ADO59883.1 hypothetical protein PPSC2_25550 [Paenibacillus polymyxa SC2]WPQ59891.1 hypothetical protein SKN87_26755 [Paenibacillus polymyxa]